MSWGRVSAIMEWMKKILKIGSAGTEEPKKLQIIAENFAFFLN